MRWLRLIRARLHALLHRDAVAGEIRDELRFHLDSRTEEYERAGLSSDEARRRAKERVGNLAVHQDRGYDVRGGGVIETIWQDVRYSLRLLRRQRGFTIVAIATLALGIGASTAIFSVIDAAILRPLPYPHPEQLVRVSVEVEQPNGRLARYAPSYDDMVAFERTGAFQAMAMWGSVFAGRIIDGEAPERVTVGEMTVDYLRVFGAAPVLGRAFTADDMAPNAPPVLLLSYGYWQSHFGGEASAIGRTVRFDDETATVIGVLPAHFESDTPMWRPIRIPDPTRRGTGRVVSGRLAEGVSNTVAEARLTAAVASTAGPDGKPLKMAIRAQSMVDSARGEYRTTVNVLSGAVGAVLLIACVNVAGLLLARGATRHAELAVRASIGAGRWRLIRQLLTESLVVALAGGAIGAIVAWLTLDALVSNIPLALYVDAPVAINARVLVASLVLTILTGVIFGFAPALRLSRVSLGSALARGSRRQGQALSTRGGQWLIAAEVALAVVLVAGAGLMLRSFARITSVDLGFDPDPLVTMMITPVGQDRTAHAEYFAELTRRLRQIPGVVSAGGVDNMPLGGSASMTSFTIEDKSRGVYINRVLPGYFETIGLPVLQGRLPADTDVSSGRHVMVISDAVARDWFPGANPIGRQVQQKTGANQQTWEIGAVVADLRSGGPLYDASPTVYVPYSPEPSNTSIKWIVMVARTDGRSGSIADALRRTALGIGPHVVVERLRTGSDLLSREVVRPRQRTVLLALLGGLGLLLALVGVFGMTAYAVARRTQEIGVRMAFGASPMQVVGAMVRDSAVPIAAGTLVGLGGAALATRLIKSFLFNTTPTDPMTFAAVAATLAAAGCLAAWVPARRAAHVDPVSALRVE